MSFKVIHPVSIEAHMRLPISH